MTTNRQFPSASDALVEFKQDASTALSQPLPASPTLNRVLAEIVSLPREALFLGVAVDGLPVLLNLHDPIPGPLLVLGDEDAGKTTFLRMLARGVQQIHRSEDVQFGVITPQPGEWEGVEATSHHAGIFCIHESGAQNIINSLAGWAHRNKSGQSVLLLIDDLESVTNLEQAVLQNLRWLLLRGPAHKVWPIITLNAEKYRQVLSWIPMFRTRIFGRLEDELAAEALGGDKASALNQLEGGVQFSLRENGHWLRFWLPSC